MTKDQIEDLVGNLHLIALCLARESDAAPTVADAIAEIAYGIKGSSTAEDDTVVTGLYEVAGGLHDIADAIRAAHN